MGVVKGKYLDSKKIIGHVDYPEFKYLNLCEREDNGTCHLLLSKEEKPKIINPRVHVFFPKSFKDSKLAKELFKEINSITDFGKKLTKGNSVLLY